MSTERTSGARVAPLFDPTQEVRFAVVLYGGVSLAIYLNGIVQELLHLVRATAPAVSSGKVDRGRTRAWLGGDGAPPLGGSEAVYRRLGQMLSAHGFDPEAEEGAPVRTRFVVDILSGSSAGGINAVFLGKALANEQGLDLIKDLWADEADIALLLNDRESLAGCDDLRPQQPRRSLLNSDRLYWKLLVALGEMDGGTTSPARDSRLVDELDCWLTATDIRGLVLPIELYDMSVLEPRYKNVFRFYYRGSHATGADAASAAPSVESRFGHEHNPFLAFAARCSSSFPFAFDPEIFTDACRILRTPRFRAEYPEAGSSFCERYRDLYRDYERAAADPSFTHRSFGDGGYLDNKPFTWATDTLARRRADLPVDRRLIYLEPSPEEVSTHQDPTRPGPIENVLDALTKLPRAETIREDLERLRERNRRLERIRAVVDVIDRAAADPAALVPSLPGDAWRALHLPALIAQRGLQWATYLQLQVALVLDALAQHVTRLLHLDDRSRAYVAVRAVVQAWFERVYETAADPGPDRRTQSSFLLDLDLDYRLRRLNFVDRRIEQLLSSAGDELRRALRHFAPLPEGDGWEEDFRQTLREVKAGLNEILVRLRSAGRAARGVPPGALFEPLAALGLTADGVVARILEEGRGEEDVLANARAFVADDAVAAGLTAVADGIAGQLAGPIGTARADALALRTPREEPAGSALARRVAGHFYEAYESYDMMVLPLTYGSVGEAGDVAVIRFSPLDATTLIDESTETRRKLGGAFLHHFGAFLNRDRRVSDMMWGRLDAAERLITTLVPPGPEHAELRSGLIRDAHLAIVEDERARVFPAQAERSAEELLDFLDDEFDAQDLRLDPGETLRVGERSLEVTSGVLAGAASGPGRVLGVAVPPVLQLLRASLSRWSYVAVALAVLAAAALIACGAQFDVEPAARTGWTLVPYLVSILAIVLAVRRFWQRTIEPRLTVRPVASTGAAEHGRPAFPTPAEEAAYLSGRRRPSGAAAAVVVLACLLLVFPLSLLNADISVAVSWLPGWS